MATLIFDIINRVMSFTFIRAIGMDEVQDTAFRGILCRAKAASMSNLLRFRRLSITVEGVLRKIGVTIGACCDQDRQYPNDIAARVLRPINYGNLNVSTVCGFDNFNFNRAFRRLIFNRVTCLNCLECASIPSRICRCTRDITGFAFVLLAMRIFDNFGLGRAYLSDNFTRNSFFVRTSELRSATMTSVGRGRDTSTRDCVGYYFRSAVWFLFIAFTSRGWSGWVWCPAVQRAFFVMS